MQWSAWKVDCYSPGGGGGVATDEDRSKTYRRRMDKKNRKNSIKDGQIEYRQKYDRRQIKVGLKTDVQKIDRQKTYGQIEDEHILDREIEEHKQTDTSTDRR